MFFRSKLNRTVLVTTLWGAFCLLSVSSSGRAEPTPLDDAPPSAEKKPDTDQPKEKKPVTVPTGTSLMVKTGEKVTSDDKPGRRFSAELQSNLMAGDEVVAKQGTQVYGQVVKSAEIGRGIVTQHSDLVLTLTDINIDGTMYPIQTGSFSENANSVLLKKRSVVVPAGSLLEFKLKAPLTVKK